MFFTCFHIKYMIDVLYWDFHTFYLVSGIYLRISTVFVFIVWQVLSVLYKLLSTCSPTHYFVSCFIYIHYQILFTDVRNSSREIWFVIYLYDRHQTNTSVYFFRNISVIPGIAQFFLFFFWFQYCLRADGRRILLSNYLGFPTVLIP